MKTCPKCNTALPATGSPDGSCPACRAVLAPVASSEQIDVPEELTEAARTEQATQGSDTVEGQAVDMTIDLAIDRLGKRL